MGFLSWSYLDSIALENDVVGADIDDDDDGSMVSLLGVGMSLPCSEVG